MEVEGVEGRKRDFQEALMQDITDEEEQLIRQTINQDLKLPWSISRQDLSKLREGSINMDIIQVYLTRFLSHQDEKLCEKDPTRSKSVYYPYFIHNYYDVSNKKYIYRNVRNYSTRNKVAGGDIFKTKYIFIPIHQGKHFTCAVTYMQDKKIMYYDSYLNTHRTRTLCSHKKEEQERILQALLLYLKDEHQNKHSVKLPNEYIWKLHSLCNYATQHDIPKIVAYLFACIANLSCTTLTDIHSRSTQEGKVVEEDDLVHFVDQG
jgi:Ulp1 family protease